MIEEIEDLYKAIEELKRVDHQVYVSLKYTRTVDVIKNTLSRLINAFDFTINAMLEYSKIKKKIKEYPDNIAFKCDLVKKLFSDNPQIMDNIQFYLLLRKINKAEYVKKEEYRKNVAMIATIDGGDTLEVNIDVLKEYYARTKSFVLLVRNIIEEKKED